MTQLKICSWNIAGVKDKLQNHRILEFVMDFDIVFILESKMYFNLNVPGFTIYTNVSSAGKHRGGVIMMLKSRLSNDVLSVNTDNEGQIWLTMSWWPSLKFGGIYIPPNDSPCYNSVIHGTLASQTLLQGNIIVLGDFNGRVGTHPYITNDEGQIYQYYEGMDTTINNHGRTLMNICNNNDMVIVNNLSYLDKHFKGNLTYRQGDRWVSEIDLCLSKKSCLNLIQDLQIHREVRGSDHAPISITLKLRTTNTIAVKDLVCRSVALNQPQQPPTMEHDKPRKSASYKEIDLESLKTSLQDIPPPILENTSNVDLALTSGLNSIVETTERCMKEPTTSTELEWDRNQLRWARILQSNDSKLLWKSINWKGNAELDGGEQPNDELFQSHFEKLLNPRNTENIEDINIENETNIPYIPVLDDPFSLRELDDVIYSTNRNKSYSGICPGVLSVLPANWLLFILTLFNVVFMNVSYPVSWCVSRLVLIFKSGNKMLCGNYRGISIMDTLAKIYDTLILNRLTLWCNIHKCQAGAQKKRSCIEQILTLRLLCDYAIFKKVKLYVLFVDFSKAYDRVPRSKMLSVLRESGCGKRMLMAIRAMYSCTKHILKSAVISASIGVRQGAPTSCILFIMYIDRMVRMLHEAVVSDVFLGSLSVLLLMDDAVILATNRTMCIKKLEVLRKYCNEYGMVINESKTKFFVVNGHVIDREDLKVDGITVSYTHRYLYLGTWFTDSGRIKDIVSMHETSNEAAVNKFAIFCAANSEMPYAYKRRVFDAAVISSLLYSCESWLTKNIKGIEGHYNKLVKCLLGVRKNTSNNLCMLEAGILPVKSIIVNKQRFFLFQN